MASLVGIFDSGVGGLSVYKQIRIFSNADVVYYGDCLRAPYGNKESSVIVQYIKDDISFLQEKGVTHFVNACNSMSVMTTNKILEECNIRTEVYTDMIRAFNNHATFCNNERILILATVATITSGVYQQVLQDKGVTFFEYSCITLAGDIENGVEEDKLLMTIIPIVEYAREHNISHILYACTHYPLIHNLFLKAQEMISWSGEFIDPAQYVREAVKSWHVEGKKSCIYYTSKETDAFARFSKEISR